MADYVQLPLWEYEGEVFLSEVYEDEDPIAVVTVTRDKAQAWRDAFKAYARAQREMLVQIDTALAVEGM